MQLVERTAGPVTIVDAVGRMARNDGYGVIQTRVKELVAEGRTNILLNLEGVPYMDSSSVGELVGVFITVRNHNGAFKLLKLGSRIRHLFTVAKLNSIFEIFDDEGRAIASFQS